MCRVDALTQNQPADRSAVQVAAGRGQAGGASTAISMTVKSLLFFSLNWSVFDAYGLRLVLQQ